MDPCSYIPDILKPASRVEANIVSDYGSFVNINQIKTGYGEKWAMILDNISQSESFYKALSVIEGISSVSIVAFNNYLDNNPSDVNSFTHENGIYTVLIKFENNIISYAVSYSGSLPLVGEQNITMAIAMDVTTGIRSGYIKAGDSNALRYIVSNNNYTFGIKYLNSREAYFEVR